MYGNKACVYGTAWVYGSACVACTWRAATGLGLRAGSDGEEGEDVRATLRGNALRNYLA